MNSQNNLKVAFIGLGIMGSRMAAHLIKNNIHTSVWSRSQSSRDQFEYQKNISESLEAAVHEADIVISMLSTPQAVSEVLLNDDGVLSKMKKGAIWMDSSTVNPSFSVQCFEKSQSQGIEFIDAPVAGSKPQAENAELVFFAGGSENTINEAKPLMEIMGSKVIHIGDHGRGSAFKMVVNIMLAQSMAIFSEATHFGESMGLSKEFLLNTLPNLVVSAPFTKFKSEAIKKDDYSVQFPLEWMHKDLMLATETAKEIGRTLHMANTTQDLYDEALKQGLNRMDFSAIHKALA